MDDTVIINTELYKNEIKIESAKTIIKLNKTATIKKDKNSSNSVFTFIAKRSENSQEDSLNINTKINHTSLQYGKIKVNQDFIVKNNIKLKYEYIDKSKNRIGIHLTARILRPDNQANNKICMASIYGAQTSFKNKHLTFANSYDKLLKHVKCPKNAKITVVRTQKAEFIAIGIFKNGIWVINQDKYLIQAQK